GRATATNVLVWSIASVASCSSTSASMTIRVAPATSIANAGTNQTLCISSNSTTLAGNTPTSGVGTWSFSSGSGVITAPNNPNSTVTGLATGTNVLVWSIASVASCSSTSASMTIQVDPATSIANAGTNQTLCISSNSTTLAGNTPTSGVGTWSFSSGSGVITAPNNPNSTVTGLATG